MDLEFWATSIVVTATPGTGALLTIAVALGRGPRAGCVAALGCTLGTAPHLLMAVAGVAALLQAHPRALVALTALGVLYLLYMAVAMWRQQGALAFDGGTYDTASARRIVGHAVLVNLLNPKLTLFFFVFLPMFVSPRSTHQVAQMAYLGALFMVITLLIFVLYGLGAGWLRRYVIGRPRVSLWLTRLFAASFVMLAITLALTVRQ